MFPLETPRLPHPRLPHPRLTRVERRLRSLVFKLKGHPATLKTKPRSRKPAQPG
jgi:hypothetical protein